VQFKAGQATNDEKLIIVHNCGMARSALGRQATDLWLSPVGSLEIKDDNI
jgi:hypothetical protein